MKRNSTLLFRRKKHIDDISVKKKKSSFSASVHVLTINVINVITNKFIYEQYPYDRYEVIRINLKKIKYINIMKYNIIKYLKKLKIDKHKYIFYIN